MNIVEREAAFRARWRSRALRGDECGATNFAASYRLVGNHRAAFQWFRRAAALGSGDDFLDVGYAYQVGLGVRRNVVQAERAYRAAIASRFITPYGREEAQYFLATVLLAARPKRATSEARRALQRAASDQDYPQAEQLLELVKAGSLEKICLCRRRLLWRIARLGCPLHKPKRRHSPPSAVAGAG